MESGTGRHRKRFVGKVHSIAGEKSVVVAVSKRVQHRLYRKYINKTRKYMAHDSLGACEVGDTVQIEECRPLSARKRWKVVKTIEKAAKAAQ